jgi:hypothetical protein
MTRRTQPLLHVALLLGTLIFAAPAFAQQASGIAGLVRDSSGAVLPGVTVEAASPALIEKVRTAVTDAQGRFNIVNLRPGTYAVTFSLPGFNSVKREGIQLTAGFTAAVNADMQVGALEETITVSGESPLIDTQNTRQQKVLSSELLEALPSGQKTAINVVSLTPGMTTAGLADVGGSLGTYNAGGNGTTFHGKTGFKREFDGMRVENMEADGNNGYILNAITVQETTVETGGVSAESDMSGVSMNMIPKEGGNAFRYMAAGLFTNEHLSTDNFGDDLRARGVTLPSKVINIYDLWGTVGGPIRQDKLWFFAAERFWGNRNQRANTFWNSTQGTPFYTPDQARPFQPDEFYRSHSGRVTWQASQRNKVNFFLDVQKNCKCYSGTGLTAVTTTAPEADAQLRFWPQFLAQVAWSAPITDRMLLEAGYSATISHWPRVSNPGVSTDSIRITEASTGFIYGAPETLQDLQDSDRYAQRFSVSYITGSHSFKSGFQLGQGVKNLHQYSWTDYNYTFLRGTPTQITQLATPYLRKERIRADLGIFAQDQWTVNRLTVNYGVRFDYYNAYVPEQHMPATRFVPARDFEPVYDVPLWKDLSPRLGAAYDLFGNGRTAVKASIGRYVGKTAIAIAADNNPVTRSVLSVTRTWTDANLNYVPDCNLAVFTLNGECGAINNANFGRVNANATQYADEAIHGWGVRDYLWDIAAEVQQQLGAGVSLNAGYYRNWYDNFLVTDNGDVSPADYSPFCITAPNDARLPGGGGYSVCGLYDISPAKFGRVTNLVTRAEHYGKLRYVSNFINLSVNTRLSSGAQFSAGFDTGRTVNDACFEVDSPGAGAAANLPGVSRTPTPFTATEVNGRKICRATTPWSANAQFKANGSYPLPGDFAVSGTLQNVAGPMITANYTVPNTLVAPSLGRDLAACGGRTPCTATVAVPLVAPQTMFEPRRTQLDLRLTKFVRLTRGQFQLNLDVYNALNASNVVTLNTNYGPSWLQPTSFLTGRLYEIGVQWSF